MDSLERMLGRAGQAVGDGANAVAGAVGKLSASSPEEFVQKLAPHAIEAAKKLGVSVRALLAQAALETGWGKHLPAQGNTNSFNMFGIKAGGSWDGKRVNVPTLEYEDGVAVRRKDSFRAYDSPSDSFKDYADMVYQQPPLCGGRGPRRRCGGFRACPRQGRLRHRSQLCAETYRYCQRSGDAAGAFRAEAHRRGPVSHGPTKD